MAGGGAKPGERRGGRQKGTPNKATKDARAVIAKFLDDSAPEARKLWLEVARGRKSRGKKGGFVVAPDPARALEIIAKLGEFVIPKLARTEHSGPHGGAIPLANATANISDDEAMKAYQRLVKGA